MNENEETMKNGKCGPQDGQSTLDGYIWRRKDGLLIKERRGEWDERSR